MSTSDAPVMKAIKPVGADVAELKLITPGKYYLRLYIDGNLNGKWDTGNLADSIQPEEVFYFAKRLDLKKNWDIEQTWDIYELPVDAQKPYAIKKNKPKLKRGEKAPREEGDEEDEDGFGGNRFGGSGNNGFGGFGGFGGGGLQKNNGGNLRVQ